MSKNIDPIVIYNFNLFSNGILTAIGLVGNTLVIYILLQPEFIKISMFRYLIAATIFDTWNLLLCWPSIFPDAFFVNQLSLSCKLYLYLFYIPFSASPWTFSLSSIDRYLSVKYPANKTKNKFKYQLLAIILVTISISLVYIPFYIYHDIDTVNGTGCVPTSFLIEFYLDLLDTVVSTVIPFTIMIVSTCLISYQLVTQKAKLQQNKKKFEKEMQLIKTLCIMDIYFLICNLPYCVLTVVDDLMGINYFGTFAFYVLNALTYVFSSCDFFVYLIFNKLFRKHFFSMISCCRKKEVTNQSANTTSTSNYEYKRNKVAKTTSTNL